MLPPIVVFTYSRPECRKGGVAGCSGFLYSQILEDRGRGRARNKGTGGTGAGGRSRELTSKTACST